MRCAVEIEQPTKQKIIRQKAVTDSASSHNVFKGPLHRSERELQPLDQLSTRTLAERSNSAEQPPDRQKLFLHRTVSRWLPSKATLQHWYARLRNGPRLQLNECEITLVQPKTKRPAYSFLNPRKQRKRNYSVNDAIGCCAVVLLANGHRPTNEFDEASHICGQRRCINVDHLRWEPMNVNAERSLCHHYGQQCHHDPPCVPISGAEMKFAANALKRLQ